MSETETGHPPEERLPAAELPPPAGAEAGATPVAPETPARRSGGAAAALGLGLLGFLLLAGGEAYLYTRTQAGADAAAGVAVLGAELAGLHQEVGRLSAAPPPAAKPEAAPPAGAAAPQTGKAPASAAPAGTVPASDPATAALQVKFANLAAQVDALQTQLASDHGALTTLQATAGDFAKLIARVRLLAALEDARMALDAGQPIGNILGAPAALDRFADSPPPTEAALRLSFPDAARKAEAASVAGGGKGGYWASVLARLENVVTVSNGTHVVLGAPAAGVIVQARARLDAGDLAGAVQALQTLSAPTQAAMAGWLDPAKALLAARQALLAMASRA